MTAPPNDPWNLPDAKLLELCRLEAFVGSGAGGQKRHKTNAAIRITYLPTGTTAQATESRSQRENRIHALRRLRHKLALEAPRQTLDAAAFSPPQWMQPYLEQKLKMSEKNPLFGDAVVVVLDVLRASNWDPARAAVNLGITTSALVRFLRRQNAVWVKVNTTRKELGLPALTMS